MVFSLPTRISKLEETTVLRMWSGIREGQTGKSKVTSQSVF